MIITEYSDAYDMNIIKFVSWERAFPRQCLFILHLATETGNCDSVTVTASGTATGTATALVSTLRCH